MSDHTGELIVIPITIWWWLFSIKKKTGRALKKGEERTFDGLIIWKKADVWVKTINVVDNIERDVLGFNFEEIWLNNRIEHFSKHKIYVPKSGIWNQRMREQWGSQNRGSSWWKEFNCCALMSLSRSYWIIYQLNYWLNLWPNFFISLFSFLTLHYS